MRAGSPARVAWLEGPGATLVGRSEGRSEGAERPGSEAFGRQDGWKARIFNDRRDVFLGAVRPSKSPKNGSIKGRPPG